MANIHVPVEHQSSPKETAQDKIVREARQDIAEGKFVPERKEGMDGYFDEGISGALAQHPRVVEMMETLERQTRDRTNAEYLEKAEMMFELNRATRKKAQWDGQDRWQGKDAEQMRMVNPMHPHQFIVKLRRAGIAADDARNEASRIWLGDKVVSLHKRNGNTGLVGLYALLEGEAAREAHEAVIQRVRYSTDLSRMDMPSVVTTLREFDEALAGVKGHRPAAARVNSLQAPYSYEWTLMRFDEYGCPTTERYHGWRTALLALILRGVLTEAEAHRAFGAPDSGPAGDFYRQQLFEHRNRMTGVDEKVAAE